MEEQNAITENRTRIEGSFERSIITGVSLLAGIVALRIISQSIFSHEVKNEIVERDGWHGCMKCGTIHNITFHHDPPQFFLKMQGIDPDQPQFGTQLCRNCHDIEDKNLLEKYGIRIGLPHRSHRKKRHHNR